MTRPAILLDTGPLVALLAPNDSAHVPCVEAMSSATGELIACWPVIAEAAWLLRRNQRTHDAMLQWLQTGEIRLASLSPADLGGVRAILKRYESLNPQFADACLVHLAEREGIDTIFTLDRRDFSVYRTTRGKSFRLLPETSPLP